MRSQDASGKRISLGVPIAATDAMTPTSASRRDRRLSRPTAFTSRDAWARMSTLERVLAADRDDPSFDYAAN
jgi:hypothetical protein